MESHKLKTRLRSVLNAPEESANLDFYLSAVTQHNPYYSTEEVLEWLRSLNAAKYFSVEKKALSELDGWHFDSESGDIQHDSGGFFAIRGLHTETNSGPIREWSQPIIDQREFGLLGIVTKEIDGILYFLMQAKAEPGNIHTFQLSPTVQATRSNFMQIHEGAPTLFMDYFSDHGNSAKRLIDQLQSEQGARFYQKRNRNTIVRVANDEELSIGPLFRWLTLGQLLELVQHDDTVNMDSRSVLSCISFNVQSDVAAKPVDREQLSDCLSSSPLISQKVSPFAVDLMLSAQLGSRSFHTHDEIIHRLTALKFDTLLHSKLIPLREVREWVNDGTAIHHEEGLYFRVLGLHIEADCREVSKWEQPILEQCAQGIVGFVATHLDGVLHFLVQTKVECGNMDILELAPTVQCITGSYIESMLPPFVRQMSDPENFGEKLIDVMQSEEGGRFYRESNQNVVVHVNELGDDQRDSRFIWMTLCQLKQFIRHNNYLNVEARSLISCLPMV